MLGRTWISVTLAVALPLTLGACGGDKDGGDGTTTDSGTGGGTVAAPLEVFVGSGWYGTCTRSPNDIEFPCEADLEYDAVNDQIVGTMNVDALWDVVIVENDDGSFSGTGAPVFGDDTLELSNLLVGDLGNMRGDWSWDYGNGVYEGTFVLYPDVPTTSD